MRTQGASGLYNTVIHICAFGLQHAHSCLYLYMHAEQGAHFQHGVCLSECAYIHIVCIYIFIYIYIYMYI
jgi:hypothetical protein